MISVADPHVWIEAWARRVDRLGLSPLALPLLELARMFGVLGSHTLLLAQPVLGGIVDDLALRRAAALLESPDLVEQFRLSLERREGGA